MAKKEEGSTALVTTVKGLGDFAILKADPASLPRLIEQNVGGGGLTAFDLDRVVIPSGGGLAFTVPTLEGEDTVKTIDAVCVFWKDVRAYWAKSFDEAGGGTPPDCSSDDALVGVGNPGGACHSCPLAQFGSAVKRDGSQGRGQACQLRRQMFMMRANDRLPIVISLPPTSHGIAKKFFLRLASNGLPYNSVVMRLGLEKDKSDDGIAFSVVQLSIAAQLDAQQAAVFESISSGLSPFLKQVKAKAEDFRDSTG